MQTVAQGKIINLLALIAVVAGCLLGCTQPASAQTPLPDPNLDLIGTGRVLTMAREADGGLIVGGDFQSINGISRRNLARLQPDGTLDTVWQPSPDGWVTALAVAPSGDIYVGGYFTNISGVPHQGLAKLDRETGAVDSIWRHDIADGVAAVVAGSNEDVFAARSSTSLFPGIFKLSGIDGSELPWTLSWEHADYLTLDGQGSLYAGASQFQAGDPWPTYHALISKRSVATGEIDAIWSPDLTGQFNDYLHTLATDGYAVYVGGTFGLRKLKASTGEDVPGWNAPAAKIATVALGAAGHIYVGGAFESIHGQAHGRIALLSQSTGLPLPWWNPSTDGDVSLISTDQNDGVDIAGNFQSVDSVQRIGLASIDSGGTPSASRSDVELPAKAFVLAAERDGGMIVGGAFHRVGASPHRNILRLEADGTLDDAWNPSLPSMPRVLAAARDGAVYVAMNRWLANERGSSTLARIDPAGHLEAGWSPSSDQWVDAMAVGTDGALFVGGEFSTIGGASRQSLAKIDAKSGVPLPGWDAHVDCCAVEAIELDGDNMFIGGTFTSAGNASRGGLAKLSAASAALDPQWTPDTGGASIYAIALDNAGSLYAGGRLGRVNGEQHPLVAKLRTSGSGETVPGWYSNFCWGPNGIHSYVSRLAVNSNGTVYAAGFFCVDPFSNERRLIKLSGENGLIDDGWGPLAWYNDPYDLKVSTSGSIYLSGNFEHAGELPRAGLAAFFPTLPDRLFFDAFEEKLW